MARFQGFKIEQDSNGFFWQEGGYFDTLQECHADIAAYNRDLRSDGNVYGLSSVQQSIAEAV